METGTIRVTCVCCQFKTSADRASTPRVVAYILGIVCRVDRAWCESSTSSEATCFEEAEARFHCCWAYEEVRRTCLFSALKCRLVDDGVYINGLYGAGCYGVSCRMLLRQFWSLGQGARSHIYWHLSTLRAPCAQDKNGCRSQMFQIFPAERFK